MKKIRKEQLARLKGNVEGSTLLDLNSASALYFLGVYAGLSAAALYFDPGQQGSRYRDVRRILDEASGAIDFGDFVYHAERRALNGYAL